MIRSLLSKLSVQKSGIKYAFISVNSFRVNFCTTPPPPNQNDVQKKTEQKIKNEETVIKNSTIPNYFEILKVNMNDNTTRVKLSYEYLSAKASPQQKILLLQAKQVLTDSRLKKQYCKVLLGKCFEKNISKQEKKAIMKSLGIKMNFFVIFFNSIVFIAILAAIGYAGISLYRFVFHVPKFQDELKNTKCSNFT